MPIRLKIAMAHAAVGVCAVLIAVMPVLIPVLFLWGLSAAGLWEAPTPDNVRKLRAEIGATD